MFFKRKVTIEQNIDLSDLALPDERRAGAEDGLSDNHDYFDVRGITVDEAKEIVLDEHALLQRIAVIDEEEQDDFIEEIEESLREDMHPLHGFDLGVGGLVLALSSIGCVPISSCNGGALGGVHSLPHPWIIFHAPKASADLLLSAAAASEVGLINNYGGMLELFSADVLNFNKMAIHLLGNDI